MPIRKIGIDLGTANTVVFVPKKGFIINEPTIVALSNPGQKVIAVGREAKDMLGKTPDNIISYRPLKDGVIADYYITKALLKYFINKAVGHLGGIFKPDVIISVPAGITQTEQRAVIGAASEAGARSVYTIREPILAALGAGIPINSNSGNMIINIGGGTAEVAVVSLGNIVSWASVRVAGNKFDKAVSNYIKKKYSLYVGEQTAEKVKIAISSAIVTRDKKEYQIRGRDSSSGLPKDVVINSNEIAEALSPDLSGIISEVQNVFNNTPPELVADIMEKGIILSGGGAQISNLPLFIKKSIGVNAYVAENPLFCVARGTGIVLSHFNAYARMLSVKK